MKRSSSFRSSSLPHVIGRLAAAAAVGVVVSLSGLRPAAARQEYPGVIEKAFDASCTPACILCHTDPNGGAENLRDEVLLTYYPVAKGGSPDGLKSVDSDLDLVSDYDEIHAGRDPLAFGDASICTPVYGCGASHVASPAPSRQGRTVEWVLASGVALALSLRLSRRRKGAADAPPSGES